MRLAYVRPLIGRRRLVEVGSASPSPTSALREYPAPPNEPSVGDITAQLTTANSLSAMNSTINGASPGDVIAFRGGTYSMTGSLSLESVGTEANPITVMAYPGETVILDFSGASSGSRVWMNGTQWTNVFGLRVHNSKSHGFYLEGNGKPPAANNNFVNCVMKNSALTGWAVVRGSYNKIWHSLAIWTSGAGVTPGDADGFGPGGQLGYSEGNACYACVAVDVPDDGFDTWQSFETQLLCNYSIRAGQYGGDGNGFKFGRGLPPEGAWTHPTSSEWYRSDALLRGNLAIDSSDAGFNSNSGANAVLEHNTAINSGTSGYLVPVAGDNPTPLPSGNISTNTIKNNINLGTAPDQTNMVQTTNSWTVATITSADFDSVTSPATAVFDGLSGKQAFDLMETGVASTLGRLVSGSDAIGAATELGYGTDLGAFPA